MDPSTSFRWPAERPRPTPPASEPVAAKPPIRWKRVAKYGIIWGSVAIALAIYLAPTPAGLTVQGKTAWAVFILCTGLWVSNAMPFGVTGLLAVGLLAATGAMQATEAFAAFGNPAVFFLIYLLVGAAFVALATATAFSKAFFDMMSEGRKFCCTISTMRRPE